MQGSGRALQIKLWHELTATCQIYVILYFFFNWMDWAQFNKVIVTFDIHKLCMTNSHSYGWQWHWNKFMTVEFRVQADWPVTGMTSTSELLLVLRNFPKIHSHFQWKLQACTRNLWWWDTNDRCPLMQGAQFQTHTSHLNVTKHWQLIYKVYSNECVYFMQILSIWLS